MMQMQGAGCVDSPHRICRSLQVHKKEIKGELNIDDYYIFVTGAT
jgi:hypothetical protein